MADQHDRPDIRQRRRITRLRAELELVSIPPHVGSELRVIAPRVSEQVVRLLARDPAYAALSPDGQEQLLSAVPRTVVEFAHLVEDRPPPAPPVEIMLAQIVRTEDQPELCRAAFRAAFQTLRQVTLVLWPHLPQARGYSSQLDAALVRYGGRLCARSVNAHRSPTSGPSAGALPDEPHPDGLLARVERRWGTQPVPLYLSVSTPGTGSVPAAQGTARLDTARSLRIDIADHVVIVGEDPTPPGPAGAAQPSVAVCVGPVPISGVGLAYDSALLLLRLIQAGVATPPSPVLIAMPNLGFLHPCPSEASVLKIQDLLHPLTEQSSHRRTSLARTLQVSLRTATTAQGLARHLAMHTQTVHNHLAALRALYNTDLDFAEDNLAMQAALDLVIPLWELEASARRTP